jgi:hypothetical protein
MDFVVITLQLGNFTRRVYLRNVILAMCYNIQDCSVMGYYAMYR